MALPLIKYTQGATTDSPGRAVVGAAGSAVVLTNGDNTGVLYWKWELLDAPGVSALSTGTFPMATLSAGGTPTASFTPDVPGTYQCRLTTYSDAGGTVPIGADVRDFIVPNSRGWKVPASRGTDVTMNYAGQIRGWSRAMEDIFNDLLTVAGAGAPVGAGVADLPTLRAVIAASRTDLQVRHVRAAGSAGGRIYRFDAASGANVADDGLYTIKPNDLALAAAGRWVMTPATILSDIFDTLQTIGYAPGPGAALPPNGKLIGISAHRGDVAGVTRDRAALGWEETSQTFQARMNTGGDRVTFAAWLGIQALSLLLQGPMLQFAPTVASPTVTQAALTPASATPANGQTHAYIAQAGQAGSGTANNSTGGDFITSSGAAGAGGSGAAGAAGTWRAQLGGVDKLLLSPTGLSLPILGPQAAGDSLYFDGTKWARLPIGTTNGYLLTVVGGLPAWAAAPAGFTAGQDLSGSSTAQNVIGIGNGVSSVAIHATALRADAANASLTLGWAAASTTGAGGLTTISGQAAKAGSAANGGGITYQTGAGDGAGTPGVHTFAAGATTLGTVSYQNVQWWWVADAALNGASFNANGAGQAFAFSALAGTIYVGAPTVILRDASTVPCVTWSLLYSGATTQTIAPTTTFTFTQAQATGTGATAGLPFTIQAQQGQAQTGVNSNTNGGDFITSSGAAGTGGSGAAGTPGAWRARVGGTDRLTLSATAVTLSALGAGFVRSTSGGLLSSSAIVAGDLPSLAGDVTGPVGTTVVAKINGITAPASAPGAAGQFMVASSTSALTYRVLAAADIPAASVVNMAGDTTGTTGANTNVGLTGTTNVVAMHGTSITWDAASAAPVITQLAQATTGKTFTLQAAPVTTGTGSSLLLAGGTGSVTAGDVQLQGANVLLKDTGGTTRCTVVAAASGQTSFTSNYFLFTGLAGANFIVNGLGTGHIYLDCQNQHLRDANANTTLDWSLVSNGAVTATLAIGVTSFALQQTTSAGATGAPMSITAQGAATTGGALNLGSGSGTTAGNVNLQTGGTTRLTISPTAITFGVAGAWSTGVAPSFGQLATISPTTPYTLLNTQWNNRTLYINPQSLTTVITFPNSKGDWLIINLSTNNAITCTAGTGATTCSVPANGRKWVTCDGANNMYVTT